MAYVPRHRRQQQPPPQPQAVQPPPLSQRKLLILDLNNVLLVRAPYEQRELTRTSPDDAVARGGLGGARKRPHLDSFLAFCFEHFEVAVWSCGKRGNMELGIFNAPLLFAWDQEHSTNLWPRHSCVAEGKPLFLKELAKVWHHNRRFDASNTILLDNHLEKFERNPLGTCVLVNDFSHSSSVDDAELAPRTNSGS
jgi:hypothetical protein